MLGVDLLGVIANAGAGKNAGGALAQAVAAVAAVAGAMQQNTGGLKTAGGVVGSLSPVQGAWDQNSAARVGSAGLWNQALQGATIAANAQTQRLIQQSATASAASKVMTYDPSHAALVDDNAAPSGSFGLNPK